MSRSAYSLSASDSDDGSKSDSVEISESEMLPQTRQSQPPRINGLVKPSMSFSPLLRRQPAQAANNSQLTRVGVVALVLLGACLALLEVLVLDFD